MEKIYANHISDKGLGSGMYKELLPPHPPHQKKRQSNFQNEQKMSIDNSSNKKIQMTNKQMKKFSTVFIIRKIQIKITIRYNYIPTRMAINKNKSTKTENDKCW